MTHFEDSHDFVASKLPPGGSNSLSLGITVGVGCALFLLNIFIFAILYHQKDRIRREMRRSYALQQHQQQQLYEKDQEMYVANNSDSLRHMNHTFRLQNQDSITTANLAAKRMSDSHPVFSQKSYSEREQFDSDLEQKHPMVRSSSPLLQLTKPKSDYRQKTVNFSYSSADNSMAAYRSSISDCPKISSPSPSGSPAGQFVNQTIPKKVLPPPPPPSGSNSFNRVAFAPSVDFFNPGESSLIPDHSWSNQSFKTSSLRPACHRPGTYSSGTDQISPVMQETCLDSTSLAAETDELLEALESETQMDSSGGSPSTVVWFSSPSPAEIFDLHSVVFTRECLKRRSRFWFCLRTCVCRIVRERVAYVYQFEWAPVLRCPQRARKGLLRSYYVHGSQTVERIILSSTVFSES